MPTLIRALLALSLGLLVYLAIPIVVMQSRPAWRARVGRFYGGLGARCLKQFSVVRRILSGFDVLPIKVDDEEKRLKVTLASSTLGDDAEYFFTDPDSRLKRLWNKPVTVCYERIPAAIDAELAEWGHWVREKKLNDGLEEPGEEGGAVAADGGARGADGQDGDPLPVLDPYVPVSPDPFLVDPVDAYELVPNGVDPENIKTAEKKTKQRFAKYGSGVGFKETVRWILAFAAGAGAVAALQYVNDQLLDNAGPGIPSPVGNRSLPSMDPGLGMDALTTVDPGVALDVVVILA